jgi:hypothetical protein
MRVLVIDEKAKEKISKLIDYANAHQYSMKDLKKVIFGDHPPAGDYPEHVIALHKGYKVVFSIEEQPVGLCKHLSISVDTKGKAPSVEAVELIMDEFGMGNDIHDCLNVWVEEEHQTVNVLTLKG